MKVLFINSVCGIGSTGRICTDLAEGYLKEGYEVKIAYGRENVPEKYQKYAYRIGSNFSVNYNVISCRLFDNDGFASKLQTKKFIKWADEYNPDILWIHNLHGYYINVEMLFNWIKMRPSMQVKWTLHDCWSFTGHCSCFDFVNCDRWKTGCSNCPNIKEYPKSLLFDQSKKHYNMKKKLFCGVNNLEIITPSKWLANLVKLSHLKEYPVRVINNKIDLSVFKPITGGFREKYYLENKFVVLGVASAWQKKKGLDDFIELSKMLDDRFKVVLVGLTAKQKQQMPKSILGIEKTHSKFELAEIYSTADVFVNLTYEDTYPTVNLEAQACGTPCITYNTGGCPETIYFDNSKIVKRGDLIQVKRLLLNMNKNNY